MYNLEVKQRYLETLNSIDRKKAEALFKKSEEVIEFKKNKDMAEFNKQEFIYLFEHLGLYSYVSLRTYFTTAKNYFAWYNENIKEIDITFLNKGKFLIRKDVDISIAIKDNLLGDFEELRDLGFMHSIDDNFFLMPVCVFLWLGIDIKSILELRNDCLKSSSSELYVINKDDTIRVPTKYMKQILLGYQKNNAGGSTYIKPTCYTTSEPLSPITDITINSAIFRASSERTLKGYKNINPTIIMLSGALWRLRERERSGKTLIEEDFAKEFSKKSIAHVYDMMALYEYYKKVFGE